MNMQHFNSLKAIAFVFLYLISTSVMAAEVNIYSARKEDLIKPLLVQFENATNIKVNLITGKADALLQRIISEGKNSPADLLITTDAGRLYRAQKANVLQAIQSEILEESIPEQFREPEGYWYGLTLRARPIIYAVDRINPAQLSTYEALTNSTWKGQICIRSSDNIYNQSLVASLIARWPAILAKSNISRSPRKARLILSPMPIIALRTLSMNI